MESWGQTLADLASGRGAALKRHAFLLCGDDSQADDLVQEALVRAFTRPLRVRLRTMTLHATTICDGARPAWIIAVRTTFGKATAIVGRGDVIADNAAESVYLVLMKGDFAFYASVPSCAHQPTGHYFSAIFDAATFVTLEAGLGNRPPPVPLRTLGPVLNLT